MASLGVLSVKVFRRPEIGVLATGSELVDVQKKPEGCEIRNCTSYFLAAQIERCGASNRLFGTAGDNIEELQLRIGEALQKSDVLVLSGGVSMGSKDFVFQVLHKMGADIKFWKVRVKPSANVLFASLKGKTIFCLPGFTAAAYVAFEKFVRPAVLKMTGHDKLFRCKISAIAQETIRFERGVSHFLRVKLAEKDGEYFVSLAGAQVPVLYRSIVEADGVMTVAEDIEVINAGEQVLVEILD